MWAPGGFNVSLCSHYDAIDTLTLDALQYLFNKGRRIIVFIEILYYHSQMNDSWKVFQISTVNIVLASKLLCKVLFTQQSLL